MLNVKIITVGTLKEQYLRDGVALYIKRLSAFCKPEIISLKESKLPESPSAADIKAALESEADKIIAAIPDKAYAIAMCIEGKQCSSEKFAQMLSDVSMMGKTLCFVIGSSHGMSERVKGKCDFRFSVSEFTFPHQLMQLILLEAIYRGFSIMKGTKYHK